MPARSGTQAASYVSRYGREESLPGGWELRPGFFGYLLIDSDKVVAGEFKCKVADADGATQFSWVARQLDKDGDFVMLFREDDRREHRRLLGNLPTPSATYSSATKVPSRGLTDEEVGCSVAKTLAAAVANAIAQDRVDNGEGGLLNSFVIEFASKARDEAVQSALGDLFRCLSTQQVAATRRLICVCLDGELTVNRYNEQDAKERLISRLRQQDPEFGMAVEVADVVYRIMQANRSR